MLDLSATLGILAGLIFFAAGWILLLGWVCESSTSICPKCGKPYHHGDEAREDLILETLRIHDRDRERWQKPYPD